MLGSAETIETIADALTLHKVPTIVVDPVWKPPAAFSPFHPCPAS
jgi:hydroxymethylpyrimidine/phosphomethylpyrimidine kinase